MLSAVRGGPTVADPTHYRITVNVGVNEDDPHQIDYVRSLAAAVTAEVSNHGWPADAVSSERLADGAGRGRGPTMLETNVLTDEECFEVWCGLTGPQRAALAVLTDGRPQYCWKRSSDPVARGGTGAVNSTAASTLRRLKLARTLSWGDRSTGDTIEVTEIGQAVWDASVWDAGIGRGSEDD